MGASYRIFDSQTVKQTDFIGHCRSLLPTKFEIQFDHALYDSQTNYCHLVRGTTTKTNSNKLLIFEKKMLRFIANVPNGTHAEPAFLSYNVVKISSVYNYRLLFAYTFSTLELARFSRM